MVCIGGHLESDCSSQHRLLQSLFKGSEASLHSLQCSMNPIIQCSKVVHRCLKLDLCNLFTSTLIVKHMYLSSDQTQLCRGQLRLFGCKHESGASKSHQMDSKSNFHRHLGEVSNIFAPGLPYAERSGLSACTHLTVQHTNAVHDNCWSVLLSGLVQLLVFTWGTQ